MGVNTKKIQKWAQNPENDPYLRSGLLGWVQCEVVAPGVVVKCPVDKNHALKTVDS